jgi:hypothetical protein
MTWRSARPSNLAGSASRNFPKSAGVELLGRRELPEQGAEPAAQLGNAGVEKPFDRVAGLAKHPAVDRKARTFQREHESVRHFGRPFAEGSRCLRAVERAVDFD